MCIYKVIIEEHHIYNPPVKREDGANWPRLTQWRSADKRFSGSVGRTNQAPPSSVAAWSAALSLPFIPLESDRRVFSDGPAAAGHRNHASMQLHQALLQLYRTKNTLLTVFVVGTDNLRIIIPSTKFNNEKKKSFKRKLKYSEVLKFGVFYILTIFGFD